MQVLDSDFIKKVVSGVLRTLLASVGTWLVSHGLFTQDQWSQAITITAGVLVVIGASIYAKYKSRLQLNAARVLPAGVTIPEINQEVDRQKGAGL